MRLRQAHAIFEAVTTLEAAGLGFELHPFHHDFPGNRRDLARDHMSGGTEISDTDDPEGSRARAYNVDLLPGPDDDTVEACLTLGIGPDPECLLYSKYSVALDPNEDERFRGLVGAAIAEKIVDTVRKHEQRITRT
ncbi:hypothetical protein ACKI10_17350 [Streptomyces galilaeus]|uniref:Uncharacterized protein n=1 Tax=Streptomyces galilaeus TaxID=33899 RepID=A0ABW9IPB1_STRGJ